jgi:hypothetical protein
MLDSSGEEKELRDIMQPFIWSIRNSLVSGMVCLRCDNLRGRSSQPFFTCECRGHVITILGANIDIYCSKWRLHRDWNNECYVR